MDKALSWGGEWGSVGEALKAVWVVGSVAGWRCSQLLKPVTSSWREDKQKPTLRDFTGAAPAGVGGYYSKTKIKKADTLSCFI